MARRDAHALGRPPRFSAVAQVCNGNCDACCNHADAQCVAACTRDAGTFLLELYTRGELQLDFDELPLKLVYHTPCHVKALGPDRGLLKLLELIPGINVTPIEKGCTGMAGTWGLGTDHFEESMAIGAGLVEELRTFQISVGTTDCSSCRMQMEQDVDFPTIHPLKILALAWGLMPEVARTLESRPSGYRMS